jgi:hypothetical protein
MIIGLAAFELNLVNAFKKFLVSHGLGGGLGVMRSGKEVVTQRALYPSLCFKKEG